jgi:putative protease
VDALIVQDVGLVRLAAAITPELPIHASTQMTITSPEGVQFARELGIRRAVLARELSLRELAKFSTPDGSLRLPLEVFVHGALCVAYSGNASPANPSGNAAQIAVSARRRAACPMS